MTRIPNAKDFRTAEELDAWLATLPANAGSYYLVTEDAITPVYETKVVAGRVFLATQRP